GETDAAVAEVPPRLLEELLLGRAVQVDIHGVGQHELHPAQRVVSARALAHAQGAAFEALQRRRVERRDGSALATGRYSLEVLPLPVAGIAREPRHGLAALDRGRHVPVRAELD